MWLESSLPFEKSKIGAEGLPTHGEAISAILGH
jgi:hypothetical protein